MHNPSSVAASLRASALVLAFLVFVAPMENLHAKPSADEREDERGRQREDRENRREDEREDRRERPSRRKAEPLFPADADDLQGPPPPPQREKKPDARKGIPAGIGVPEFDGQPLHLLERLLNTPPEGLERIRKTVEYIEKLSPEEREALKKRIADFRQTDPGVRKEMMEHLREVPPEERRALFEYWSSLSPEEKEQEKLKIQSMTPQERRAYREDIIRDFNPQER